MSTLKVNGIRGTGASADAITVNSTDGTCTARITNNLSNRNKVINGDMKISQRKLPVQLAAVEYYIVDRFKSDTGSSYDLKADGSQATDVPAGKGFSKSLKIAADGTNTPTAGQNGGISTFLEGQDVQDFCFGSSDAKPLTLSFWAKSGSQNNGHVYGLMLGAWLGGTRNCQVKSFTVTSSWQKFTLNFAATGTAVSGSTINSDNASGCQIYWSLVCHSDDQKDYSTWTADSGLRGFTSQANFNDHASNEFYLTGVQLEVDSTGSGVATDFEHRSYGDELAKCRRYYHHWVDSWDSAEHTAGLMFQSYNSTGGHCPLHISPQMRATPTIKVSNATNAWQYIDGGSSDDFDTIAGNSTSLWTNQDVELYASGNLSTTAGEAAFIRCKASTNTTYLAFDAEL